MKRRMVNKNRSLRKAKRQLRRTKAANVMPRNVMRGGYRL